MNTLAAIFVLSSSLVRSEPAPAATLLDAAKANAGKRGTNVMVIFHASWCGWCKRLDAFMAKPTYKKLFADNYEIVHLDVMEDPKDPTKVALENPGGFDVMKKYGGEGAGLPWIFIMDKSGKKLIDSYRDGNKKQNIGCPWEPDEVQWFLTMFDKTKKGVTADQRRALEADLLKQKAEKGG